MFGEKKVELWRAILLASRPIEKIGKIYNSTFCLKSEKHFPFSSFNADEGEN